MFFRFLGYLLMTLSIAALSYDGMRMIADNGRWTFTSVYQHWSALSPDSLVWTENWVSSFGAWLWSPVAMTILLLPAWFVLVGIGVMLYLAGYRPTRPAVSDSI